MPPRRHAVLLRGVNLGGHNKVPMAALRRALTDANYDNVSTLLQSGNVVLSTGKADGRAVAADVRSIIKKQFGVDAAALAVDAAVLQGVVDECPMLEFATDPSKLLATILSGHPTATMLAGWDPSEIDPPNVAVGRQVIYQWCPQGVHKAPQLLPQVERRWKLDGTARNWNTITKLLTMLTME